MRGDSLFLTGYHTLSVDGDLSDLSVNGRANGFLLQVDREDGRILGVAAIHSQTEAYQSTVIPISIRLEGEEILLTGNTTGGVAIGSTRLVPESALDQFEIALDPANLDVLSASLTPLTSDTPIVASTNLSVETKGVGSTVLDFLGSFEANAFASWPSRPF